MAARPRAPASERNRDAILEVLQVELRDCKSVLEIGSGTGQHAVWFASHLEFLDWQTSDLAENHAGINAWLDDAGLANALPPIELDVRTAVAGGTRYDAVFSANTAHIMSIEAVECMFGIAGSSILPAGKMCLYGPMNIDGTFTSESNARFDAQLKTQDPAMGIRDLEQLDAFAAGNGMHRFRRYAMPANNMIAIWANREDGGG